MQNLFIQINKETNDFRNIEEFNLKVFNLMITL